MLKNSRRLVRRDAVKICGPGHFLILKSWRHAGAGEPGLAVNQLLLLSGFDSLCLYCSKIFGTMGVTGFDWLNSNFEMQVVIEQVTLKRFKKINANLSKSDMALAA